MPIEIKELHISVTVDAGNGGNAASATASASPAQAAQAAQVGQETLIAECVEQVLRILEQKKER